MEFQSRGIIKTVLVILSLVIFIASILSPCYSVTSPERRSLLSEQTSALSTVGNLAIQYQSITNEGNLTLGGSETRTIEDCEYQLNGSIIVKDNATLVIKDAIFNQTGGLIPGDSVDVPDANIVVKDQASLFLTNVTLMIPQNVTSRILIQNEAKVYITDSNIENFKYDVSIWATENSLLQVENSIIRRAKEDVGHWTVEARTVVCLDDSEVHLENLTFDRVTIYTDSRVFIERSHLKDAVRVFDNPTVQITGSIIDGYMTAEGSPTIYVRSSIIGYGNSTTDHYIAATESTTSADIWLIHMNVDKVIAGGSSKVRLIDSSVKNLDLRDDAALFVGWDLPLFGPVAFTPEVAFIIQLIALNLLAVTVIIVIFVGYRKLQRRRLNEPKPLPSASDTDFQPKRLCVS